MGLINRLNYSLINLFVVDEANQRFLLALGKAMLEYLI
jgi:hypothetical protein